MVRFKTIKFKHYRQAQEINARIDAGEATDEEVLRFALSLVAEWDFVDADTSKPLPINELNELSMEQCREVNEGFARKMGVTAEVPKGSDGPSPSTSTPSSQIESQGTSPTGYTPLSSPGD